MTGNVTQAFRKQIQHAKRASQAASSTPPAPAVSVAGRVLRALTKQWIVVREMTHSAVYARMKFHQLQSSQVRRKWIAMALSGARTNVGKGIGST